jgi:hypothetical protein
VTKPRMYEITLNEAESRVIDTVRLAFSLNSVHLLSAALRELAGVDITSDRVRELSIFAWDEQVQLALEDDLITEVELDSLAQGALSMDILSEVRQRPSYGRLHEALARQRAGLAPRTRRRPRKKTAVAQVDPSGGERNEVAAVGESHYQTALRAARGDRPSPARCDVALVPEDDNEFDAKAVRVDVAGECVGYLSRSHAVLYRRRHASRSVSCRGLLCGGDESRPLIGIWLDVEL